MWGLAIEAGLLAGSYLYHRYFDHRPKPPTPPGLQLPRTADGAPISLIYGTAKVNSPILVWSGNYLQPDQDYKPWNPGTGGDTITADHYSADLIFVIGIPFYTGPGTVGTSSSVFQIWYGDSPVESLSEVHAGPPGPPGRTVFFGGPGVFTTPLSVARQQFSFSGVFYQGDSQQVVPFDTTDSVVTAAVVAVDGHMFPDGVIYNVGSHQPQTIIDVLTQDAGAGFGPSFFGGLRNQCVAWMHVGLGSSASMSGFGFEIQSKSIGTASDMGLPGWGILTSDADPSAVLYDILTSPWGKLGLPASRIDRASFVTASTTLLAEGLGCSRCIDTAQDASTLISELLQHMDAVFYPEPTTGLLTLRLIRFDYTVSALDDINPDNAAAPESGWYSVQGWAEIPNQVKLSFSDRSFDYKDRTVIAEDPAAAIANDGRKRTITIQMPWCCDAQVAARLASRELAAVSRPMVKATLSVNLSFYGKRPGDVVTLTWPELGISKMVMRIAGIDYGQLHDGKITLQLMRDIFDVRQGAYPVL
jgi:putative tail protein